MFSVRLTHMRYWSTLRDFAADAGRFVRYQVVTKFAITSVLLPLYVGITQLLLRSSGRTVITNSMLAGFLLSPQGLVVVGLGAIVITVIALLELGGFVAISTRSLQHQPPATVVGLVKSNMTMLRRFADPGALVLLVYLLVVIPLSGMGSGLSVLQGLRIPNFISSVIMTNPVYRVGYFALIAVAAVVAFFWSFVMQFLVIGQRKPWRALRDSSALVRADFWWIMRMRFKFWLLNTAWLLVIVIIWTVLIVLLQLWLPPSGQLTRTVLLSAFMIQSLGLVGFAIFYVPLDTYQATKIFYAACERQERFNELSQRYAAAPQLLRKSWLDRLLDQRRWLIPLVILGVVGASFGLGQLVKDVHQLHTNIEVYAHRGGGNAAPENSIKGIEYAIERKANFVEIDVQRTADGHYILNHDATFQRVAGDAHASSELTLAQIKQLDLGQGVRVPTLDEAVAACNGKIGMAIELKGATADEKMVADVLSIVRGAPLTSPYLLVSLDDKLAAHIASQYPTVNVGFIYFLQMGKVADLPYGTLILEEDIATADNVAAIHAAGKRAVVWTVDTPDSIARFVGSDVDGVITDEVAAVQEALADREQRTENEALWELLFRVR